MRSVEPEVRLFPAAQPQPSSESQPSTTATAMSFALPDVPEIAADDSMLSRKFGREVANYFAGNPLNRVSFLRTDHVFLRAAFAHPSARFLVMRELAPLVQSTQTKPVRLAYLSGAEVAAFTGADPFAKTEEELIKGFNSEETHPLILLLGIDEGGKMDASDEKFTYKDYSGSPYFAVDLTPRGTGKDIDSEGITKLAEEKGFAFFTDARAMKFTAGEAAIYGQARALLDWNFRNPFCAQCGQPSLSVNAGTKRVCPPTDMAGGTLRERKPCAARKGISNLSFPRTDPTMIVAVVSADGGKLLLGRQTRWPAHFYSTLAGFLEPGESIEEAVRREVWEESGVRLGRVVIHSSQPWPFPANLMIGAIGQALPGDGETISLGHDPELEDARWVPLEEVRRALQNCTSALSDPPPEGYKEGDMRLPPKTAIAHQLLLAVVDGFVGPVTKI